MDKTRRWELGDRVIHKLMGALVSTFFPLLFVKKAVWLRDTNEAHAASRFHIRRRLNGSVYTLYLINIR